MRFTNGKIIFDASFEICHVFDGVELNDKEDAYEECIRAMELETSTKCVPQIVFPSMEAQNMELFEIIFPENGRDKTIKHTFENFKDAFEYMYKNRDNKAVVPYFGVDLIKEIKS